MTTGCGILLLVDEDVIVEAENTETKRSNGFGRIGKSSSQLKQLHKQIKRCFTQSKQKIPTNQKELIQIEHSL